MNYRYIFLKGRQPIRAPDSRDLVNFVMACGESIWLSFNEKITTAVKNYHAVLLKTGLMVIVASCMLLISRLRNYHELPMSTGLNKSAKGFLVYYAYAYIKYTFKQTQK